jgi:hypothetical protein
LSKQQTARRNRSQQAAGSLFSPIMLLGRADEVIE